MLRVVNSFVDVSQVTEVAVTGPLIAPNASSWQYVGLNNWVQSGGITVIMHQVHKELVGAKFHASENPLWIHRCRLLIPWFALGNQSFIDSNDASRAAKHHTVPQELRRADFSDHIGPVGHRLLIDFQLLLDFDVR